MNKKKKIRKLKKRVRKLKKVLSAYAEEHMKTCPAYANNLNYAEILKRSIEKIQSVAEDSKPPIST